MSEDLTIHVVFAPAVYTITYKDKNNQTFSGVHGSGHPTSHTYGTATALVNPTKANATFGGWYTSSNCSGAAVTSLGATAYTGNITLYAKWSSNGTITANAYPAAGGSVTVNQPSTTGGTAVTLNASANSGYVFSQWNDGNSDNPRTVYVDGSVNYTAQFIVEPGAWGSYSYDNANDVIEVDIEEGANNICDSYWTPYGGDFLYIIASNHTRSTSNYVQLYFKTNTMNYTYPDGRLGVAPGTYLTTTPSYTTNQCGDYTYWFWKWNDIPWEGAVAYTYDSYALGLNDQSCYAADVNYSGNSPSVTQRYKIGNYNDGSEARITVSVGKDGHMHVQVRKVADNSLLINIGEPASLHNVSITAPENGTITVSYNDGSAQSFTSGSRSIAEGTVLTVTTSPAADYHFNAWTGNGAASVTVNGDKTIGATFAQNDYFLNATYGAGGASVTRDDSGNSETVKRAGNTVTLTPTAATGYNFLAWGGADAAKMSGNVFTFPTNGTHNTTYNVQATFQAITYNISYEGLNGATNSNPETYTIESNDITLVAPGTRTGYTFTGWTCGGNAITQIVLGSTGDKTITANWSQNTYTVTLNANGGASDQTTTATYNSGDLTAWTAPTKSGGTLTGYFTAASEGAKVINADGTLVADVDGYTDASGNWIYDDNATLYAQWEDVPSVLELEDNHNSSDAWWTDYDNLRTALGEGTITVRYMRELPADKWCVFALPFGYSFRSGSTLKGCVYELGSAEYTGDGQLTFYFAPVTTKIEANRPYLYRSATGHTNPEFANVQLQAVADGSYSVDNTNTTVGGTVTLHNTTARMLLTKEKSVIYIQNNRLYYPNLTNDTWMRAFRGYFTLDGMAINHIAPRVRIVVAGETATELEVVQEDGTATKDNVRKYMKNGVLVIERNGVRYDATGARID